MKNVVGFIMSWVLCLGWLSAGAQVDSLLRQADRLLAYKSFGRAIDTYTLLLTDEKLTSTQVTAAQGRLAYAYQQVGDGQKAEKYYREAMRKSVDDAQLMLHFAQTLAGNGKFQESQEHYQRYLHLKDSEAPRSPAPSPIEKPARVNPRKTPTRYRLELLSLNSENEEFSPTFYRDGLVYVAGTKGGATIETTGRGGGSGYLDLFYVPNRSELKVKLVVLPDGKVMQPRSEPPKANRPAGRDVYSRQSANDSPMVPGFGERINITEGLNYESAAGNKSQRFDKSINTKYHEGPATFSSDGSRIIFTRNSYNAEQSGKGAGGVNRLQLFTARQLNGIWVDVRELPFNSEAYSVGHPTLSRDEKLLFFASDMPGGYGGTDLYVSRFWHGEWSKPVNLGGTINSVGNELFPFVDDAGNLYFSSDGRQGMGGLDIYYASLTNGTNVKTVEHLEAPINSANDDFGLITDRYRRGGYFSSDRRDGNDDIYRFVRENSLYGCRNLTLKLYDSKSEQPLDSVNLIVKMKAEGQESQLLTTDLNGIARICLEGNSEFVVQANRDGYVSTTVGFTMKAADDEQSSRLEIAMMKPTVIVDTITTTSTRPLTEKLLHSRIWGIVISERNHKPIPGVTVRLRNECDKSMREYKTGPDGRYMFDLVEGCDFTLVASKPTFGTNTNKIRKLSRKAKPKELAADLRMLGVGDVVAIDNIYYDLDRYSLRPDAARELDKLVMTMRKYPSLIIEIRSHTDSRGDAARNKALSTQRALEVANYLESKGISRRRMTTIGMGESQLVNNCADGVICTEAEHQRNRRTEFRVVEIK